MTLALALGVAAQACASIPPGRSAIDSLDFEGTHHLDDDELQERIASAPSPKFLLLFRGVAFDFSIYDRQVLERDLERIARFYRARGYYDVKVRAARIERVSEEHVAITVEVEEGEPVRVATVELRGLETVPPDVALAAREGAAGLRIGAEFDEDRYIEAQEQVARALTDAGYAWASVVRQARVDLARRVAGVWYHVVPGPKGYFGEIEIVGEGPLQEGPIRRALNIRKGQPYSTRLLDDARDAVLGLGVFSNVDITPQVSETPPADATVGLLVRTTPQKLRAIELGGGVELDLIRTDVHLRARWEHRNFLGGYRRFSLEFKPGVVPYPTRVPSFQTPTRYLLEEKLQGELRQPGFVEARTVGVLRAEFNVLPVLLSPRVDPEAPVLGYRELKAAEGAERRHRWLFVALYHNLQRNSPFSYAGMLDPALHGVTVSYLDLLAQLDFRDRASQPHKGLFFGLDVQVAGGPLLGDARDLRLEPEARGYVPVARRVTIALRAKTGLLFPFNYGETLRDNARAGTVSAGISRARWMQDVQLVYFRGFFSGGPNSNRGYALRGVGPHGVVPFFSPQLAQSDLAAECDLSGSTAASARCQQPLGGMSLWEASTELRFPVSGDLGSALFCDVGDVSPNQVDIRLDYLHLSCGAGLRYATPIGPIRFDVGYRVPGAQVLDQPDSALEGNPGTILGQPLALSLGIGEAF